MIVASSFNQARIAYEHCRAFLESLGHDLASRKLWRSQDTVNTAMLEDRKTGARVRVIGSDPKRAHGLAPVMVLADEPSQWPRSTADAMLAALRTSLGKIPDSRLFVLGTRPASEDHFFSAMLDGGAAYSQSHHVASDLPDSKLFTKKVWRRANPSLDAMPHLESAIRTEAKQARKDPAMLQSFKSLRLNMGCSEVLEAVLLTAQTWRELETETLPPREGRMALGLDLGSSAAMSAAAAYWPASGRLECFAAFPDTPNLADRGLRDGVGNLYQRMADRGELIHAGRRVASIPEVLAETQKRWGNADLIVCDTWREAELRQALEDASYPHSAALVVRRQGFFDGGADVRKFRECCLDGRVKVKPSLLLRSAMAEARIVNDPAGNCKLSKGHEGGRRLKARDDAAAATILAVAVGTRAYEADKSEGEPVRITRVQKA